VTRNLQTVIACVVAASSLLPACGDSGGRAGAASPADGYTAELQRCVELTNRYRAAAGLAPLARSARLETYAARAAASDGRSHAAHAYFDRTEGGGIALAENVIPWWPLSRYGSVRGVIERGLAGMWNEGPGGSHYRNMTGGYSQVGCGIFVGRGEVTVVQAFR